MSNLYKQWFVNAERNNARVINSDAVLAECLEKSAYRILAERSAGGEASGEEFAEGLLAEAAGNVIKAQPEIDHLEKAKEEAERILQEAHAQAQELVARAREEADDVQETARNQGYQDGEAKARQKLEELESGLRESYEKRSAELACDYEEKRRDMEQNLVDAIIKVFNRVFHIQFDDKKDILMHLVEDAMLHIEGEKKFRIKTTPENSLFLQEHKEEILEKIGCGAEIEIQADPALDGNACVIEADSGVFDCGPDTQLGNLIKDIRSLCS